MPRRNVRPVSNSQADRAGDSFRAFVRQEITAKEVLPAVRTIVDYRTLHEYPLTRVTIGVGSMIRTATGNGAIRPGQRFKRLERILDKLLRYPQMRLSQMEDIGGCRAVFDDPGQLYLAANRIMSQWRTHAKLMDHIAAPKPDGYRGVHIVERRDGRLIEVQLRTAGQHRWAEVIETWGPRLGHNLKDGKGPADLREYFRCAADRIAAKEFDQEWSNAEEAGFVTLRERVLHYFQP